METHIVILVLNLLQGVYSIENKESTIYTSDSNKIYDQIDALDDK